MVLMRLLMQYFQLTKSIFGIFHKPKRFSTNFQDWCNLDQGFLACILRRNGFSAIFSCDFLKTGTNRNPPNDTFRMLKWLTSTAKFAKFGSTLLSKFIEILYNLKLNFWHFHISDVNSNELENSHFSIWSLTATANVRLLWLTVIL